MSSHCVRALRAEGNDYFVLGRLSKDDIDRMVREADEYRAEDDKQRERIQAKNGLESYAFNMKSTVEDEKLQVRNKV